MTNQQDQSKSPYAGHYIPITQALPHPLPENWEVRNDHPSGLWAFVNQFDRTRWQFEFPSEAVPLPVLPDGWKAMPLDNDPNRPAHYPKYYFLDEKTGQSHWLPPSTNANPSAPPPAQSSQPAPHQPALWQPLSQSTAGVSSWTPTETSPNQQAKSMEAYTLASNKPLHAPPHSEVVSATTYDDAPPAYDTITTNPQVNLNHSSDAKVSNVFMNEKGGQYGSSSSSTTFGPVKVTKRETTRITTESGTVITLPGSNTLRYSQERLAKLKGFDIAVLIDNSRSMVKDISNNYPAEARTENQRWTYARKAIATLAPFCTEYDTNGIDIHFLNVPEQIIERYPPTPRDRFGVRTADEVEALFKNIDPQGPTPLGARIKDIICEKYLAEYESSGGASEKMRPLFLLVITDGQEFYNGHFGVPEIRAVDVIKSIAERLDRLNAPPRQIGIQFLQIGNDDEASQYLEMLDNNIVGCKRDIVDTVNYKNALSNNGVITPEGLLKIMLGAILKDFDDAGLEKGKIASGLEKGEIASGLEKGEIASGLEKGKIASGLERGEIASGLEKGKIASGLEKGKIASGLERGEIASGLEKGKIASSSFGRVRGFFGKK